MLIVWKWRDMEREGRVVNMELLAKPEYRGVTARIQDYAGVLFDYYDVCEQRPNGTAPLAMPRAKVVRTFVEHKIRDLQAPTFQFLQTLIKHLKRKDNELFVFLHRRDGFGNEEVSTILKSAKADRCFLIGDGRDNIYYRQMRNQGLLGDNGRFFRRESSPGSPSISIADNKDKKVFLNHFKKVWNYYKHEFRTKIYELKEDLLSHFYAVYPDDQVWTYQALKDYLEQDRALYLRVSSFIDDNCHYLDTSSLAELDHYGKSVGKSYEFDDLRMNLAEPKDVNQEYLAVSKLLYDLFHQAPTSPQQKTLNELLREIKEGYTRLLNVIH